MAEKRIVAMKAKAADNGLMTLSSRALALNLVKSVRSGPVISVSPWREEPWLEVKTFLHEQLPEPALEALYTELFVTPTSVSGVTLNPFAFSSKPPFSLLEPSRAVLLWWFFFTPTPKSNATLIDWPVFSLFLPIRAALLWFKSKAVANSKDSPLLSVPRPMLQSLMNPTMTQWYQNFTIKFNLILARFLAQEEQHDAFHSLGFRFDEELSLSDWVIVSLAARNQPNLRRLKLIDCCDEATLGAICAEISAPLEELVFTVRCDDEVVVTHLPVPTVKPILHECLSRFSTTLTTLELSFENAHSTLLVNEVNACCPNITKLSLAGGIPRDDDQEQQQLPFLSVKDLTLEYFYDTLGVSADFSHIPVVYPNVSDLKLKGNFSIGIDADSLVHLEALSHCITELNCISEGQVRIGQILKCCPKASKIHLVCNDVQPVFNSENIIALPCLKDLYLQEFGNHIKAEDIVHLLESYLDLEKLMVTGTASRDFNMAALMKSLREKRVLRHLKELHVILDDGHTTSNSLPLELLSLPELNSLTVFPWCKMDQNGMKEVLALAEKRRMEVTFETFSFSSDDGHNCIMS